MEKYLARYYLMLVLPIQYYVGLEAPYVDLEFFIILRRVAIFYKYILVLPCVLTSTSSSCRVSLQVHPSPAVCSAVLPHSGHLLASSGVRCQDDARCVTYYTNTFTSVEPQVMMRQKKHDGVFLFADLLYLMNTLLFQNIKPNTHRRRDETVLSRRRRRCEHNSQLAHDDCRRIRSTL